MGCQPLPTNTILGNGSDQYRIDTVLGPGGFGVTYLARDLRFERDVAIKEYFPAEFAYRDGSTTIRSSTRGNNQNFFEQGKRHFLDEARTLAKFRHEHIVRVLNLFEQFNTAYMVLEFEEGQSLKAWLRALGHQPGHGLGPGLGLGSDQQTGLSVFDHILVGRQIGIDAGRAAGGIFQPFDGAFGPIKGRVGQGGQTDGQTQTRQFGGVGSVIRGKGQKRLKRYAPGMPILVADGYAVFGYGGDFAAVPF